MANEWQSSLFSHRQTVKVERPPNLTIHPRGSRGGVPIEGNIALGCEARAQPTNWEQGRPTHSSGTSHSRTQCDAQGGHAERALQQPPNAVDAERAIGNQPPPLPPHGACELHKVGGCTPRAGVPTQGLAVGSRAVTSPLRAGLSMSCGDARSLCRGTGGRGRSRSAHCGLCSCWCLFRIRGA